MRRGRASSPDAMGVIGGPKVRSNERIDRRLAPRRASPPSRHQKERSQVVEPVNFWRGVGQPSTLTHHRVKTVVMVGVEREEQPDDRVPRVSPDCPYEIAAHFALETSVRRRIHVNRSTID